VISKNQTFFSIFYENLRSILINLFNSRFSPDIASKRGLTAAEVSAVDAIHRAVEFNPHSPKVRN
jgi:hypothetical protein